MACCVLLPLLLRVCALRRGELKLTTLKLATSTRNNRWCAQNTTKKKKSNSSSSSYTGRGVGGKQQHHHQREDPPTAFQVDTVLGPGCDTSQVSKAPAILHVGGFRMQWPRYFPCTQQLFCFTEHLPASSTLLLLLLRRIYATHIQSTTHSHTPHINEGVWHRKTM